MIKNFLFNFFKSLVCDSARLFFIFVIQPKIRYYEENSLFLAVIFSTASYSQLTDANFQTAINECLTTNPEDGLCTNSEYGANARLGCKPSNRYE